jgi:acyl carrier protein
MSQVIARFGSSLRGVIHAAADMSFCALDRMDDARLKSALRAKVQGTWVLHELTRNLPLDFFVCFSSAASVLGAESRAHYAAANHFLDSFAHYARATGRPVISINWGNLGPASKPSMIDGQRSFEQIGVIPMRLTDVLEAVPALLHSHEPQAMLANLDWSVFKPLYEAKRERPMVERMLEPRAIISAPDASNGNGHHARSALIAAVEAEIRDVLAIETGVPLDRRRGFFDMGMDSLTSVELRKRLETTIGRDLPATLTFTYPNITELIEFLAGGAAPVSVAQTAEDGIEESLRQVLEGAGY